LVLDKKYHFRKSLQIGALVCCPQSVFAREARTCAARSSLKSKLAGLSEARRPFALCSADAGGQQTSAPTETAFV